MARRLTVQNLIDDVRSMLDEDNRESIKTDEDILPALNRAQDFASNILARHYESPLLTKKTIAMVAGQDEYNLPEDAFEQRLEKVEVNVNQLYYPVTRISYRDLSLYETQGTTNIPYYYSVVGNKYRILPTGNDTYNLRIWYLKDPLPLVSPQGRINTINSASNYVILDSAGDELTTEADNLDSYVNIIDGQTGERKATFQVKTITGNKITFKTIPSRSSVLNLTIDTDMTDLEANKDDGSGEVKAQVNIEEDDFICLIHGTCVPLFKKPFSNFLIQYAIAEIRRKLGGPADLELRVLKDLEQQVERSWVGREQTLRVKKRSGNWDLPIRRNYGIRS